VGMQSLNSMLFRVRPAMPMPIPKQPSVKDTSPAVLDEADEDVEEEIASTPAQPNKTEEVAAEVTPESEPETSVGPTPAKSAGSSLLQGPMTMRKAIILKEVLDKPLALRRR